MVSNPVWLSLSSHNSPIYWHFFKKVLLPLKKSCSVVLASRFLQQSCCCLQQNFCPRRHCRKPVGFVLGQQVQLDTASAPWNGLGKAVGLSPSAGPAPGEKPKARWMRELAKELFGLMVFPNFIIKSLEVVVATHPPLHAGMDQPAWMRPASLDAQQGGWFCSLYTFHLSPDVIPPFSSCFPSRCGQEASAATLRRWDHAVDVLTTLHCTFISQCPLLERRPRLPPWFLQGPTTSCWPHLGLERSVGAAPHPGGVRGLQLVWPGLLWCHCTTALQDGTGRMSSDGDLNMLSDFWVEKYPHNATSWSCCFLPKDCNSIYSTFGIKWAGKKVLDWAPAARAQLFWSLQPAWE